MKKGLVILVAMIVASISLSACDGGAKASAYERYTAANKKISEAEASEMTMVMDMSMSMEGDADAIATMQTNGVIQMSNPSDESLQFAIAMEMVMGEQASATTMYYKEGYMYLASAEGNMKMPMDVETAMQQLSSSEMATFPEEAIKDTVEETKDGNDVYTFTIDGAQMTEIMGDVLAELTAGLAEDAEIAYRDLLVVATIDKNDNMKACDMVFSAAITIEGQTMVVNYDVSISDIKTEGVTVSYPEDLESYIDISEYAS